MPTEYDALVEKKFDDIRKLLQGEWRGEGLAKFPTIETTAYKETWTFTPDDDKDSIHYSQKTLYKNDTPNDGKTVFWDTGFILLKENKILWVSAQVGGRTETYALGQYVKGETVHLVFDSIHIGNDAKTIRSQRVLHIGKGVLGYELNMSTHQATEFQNHLSASLTRAGNGTKTYVL